jgi:alpha,alpha-trehalose phosphorylase
VLLEHARMTFEVEQGERAEVVVRGETLIIDRSGPVTVELDGQGPRLNDNPRLRTGEKRPDGTLITATVPAATTPPRPEPAAVPH